MQYQKPPKSKIRTPTLKKRVKLKKETRQGISEAERERKRETETEREKKRKKDK